MGLALSGAVYLFCLVIGLGLLIISALLGHLTGGASDGGGVGHDVSVSHDVGMGHDAGGGHDAGTDHGVGGGHEVGPGAVQLSMWSTPVMSTLLVFFGGTGLILENGFGIRAAVITAPVSAASGLLFATIVMALLSKLMTAMTGTTHQSLDDIVGTEAEVLTPIPAEGLGEVAYALETGRHTSPARSEEGVIIPRHSMVRITKIVGNTVVVHALVDERLRELRPQEPTPPLASGEGQGEGASEGVTEAAAEEPPPAAAGGEGTSGQ
jgi:membrane protein implicated in regulation of membrane protease activity